MTSTTDVRRHVVRCCYPLCGSLPPTDPDWTQAFPPFKIAGNLYYVGSADLAAYLVTTPQGNILINSNLESSPDLDQTKH